MGPKWKKSIAVPLALPSGLNVRLGKGSRTRSEFSHGFGHGIIRRIRIVGLVASASVIHYCNVSRVLPFLRRLLSFWHRLPLRSLLLRSIIATFSFIVLPFFVLGLAGFEPKSGPQEIVCENHYAIEIPGSERNSGRYLRCEDFDEYYELEAKGRHAEAEAKLLPSR